MNRSVADRSEHQPGQPEPPPSIEAPVVLGPGRRRSGALSDEFHHFYQREFDGQVRRAYLLLGALAPAQDAVHDAFIAVFDRWERIAEPGPYLNRCVLNACRDRAAAQRRSTPVPDPDRDLVELPGPADSRLAELWDVLNELSFNQRSALVLRYFEGRTENQIANHLGVRPGTVGPLITRALRALQRKVSP